MVFCAVSCSYSHRFNRLLKNHPNLRQTISRDSSVVDFGKTQDTIVVFKKDTIAIEGVRIIRGGLDSVRIITHERPCTTYIRQTILQPAKSKAEKRSDWKQEKYKIKKQAEVEKAKATSIGDWVFRGFMLVVGFFLGIFMGLIIKQNQ